MRMSRDGVREALRKDGRFSRTIRGIQATIELRGKKYWITIHEGEKPPFWTYRRESIALDRFEEQCDMLNRRKS